MSYKLTDSEIKKALEDLADGCFACHSGCSSGLECPVEVIQFTLDLINRLQADKSALVEHLKKARRQLKTAKAEEYKECIERVYKFICDTQNWGALHREFLENGECYWLKQKLDNLLKEMVGDK